ncbi:MAG: SDR family oxidoreductase, partial [Pseudomonadota bacterium]
MLSTLLKGKRGIVVGIANERSIAAGCAMAFRAAGAELAVTFANEKSKPFIAPLVTKLDAPLFLPLDVEQDGQMEAVFAAIDNEWG